MTTSYKLGSLFDGSGGFPLAGALCGIEPVWASEVEPYPIAVTRERFPKMKHLGDISKINGAEVEPVDILCAGSPCQDLSVAGLRKGLKHTDNGDEETTRSGLFMEFVRIIKEMRKATNGEYPRFALWENVPGAFSSNKGEDFRIVCEELIKVVEPSAFMPPVPKNGWNYADSFIGDGWSLAYRVFDAQYWGVPQRRRRIHLVADFRGECAREILFEREGLRGYFAEGTTPWQATPADAQGSTGADDREGECSGEESDLGGRGLPGGREAAGGRLEGRTAGGRGVSLQGIPYTLKIRSGCEGGGKGALIQEDKSATLATNNDQYLFQPVGVDPYNGAISGDIASTIGVNCGLTTGRNGVIERREDPLLFENHSQDSRYKGPLDVCPMLPAQLGTGGNNQPLVMEPFVKSARARSADDATTWKDGKVANTLNTFDQGETRANELVVEQKPVICLQGNGIDRADTAGCNGKGWKEDTSYTLNTIDRPAVVYAVDQGGGKSGANVTEDKAPTLTCTHGGEPAVAFQTYQRVSGPLMANSHPGSYTGQDAFSDMLVAGVDNKKTSTIYRQGGFADFVEGEAGTLKAAGGDLGGGSENLVVQRPSYIVRRLTPTECARLQGFADQWGHIEKKDALSDEEYAFWCEVFLTKALIDGTVVYNDDGDLVFKNRMAPYKHKTKAQMLTWYNKLWTDSAEYKMWGNGIALPPALYCMQGIVEALNAMPQTEESYEGLLQEQHHKNSEALRKVAEFMVEPAAALVEKKVEEEKQTEEELTDLSDAPKEIKEEIMNNAEQLERREGTEAKPATVRDFNAAAQLKKLADERRALANINPDSDRFADDIRALEYAINILEVVGL